MTELESERKTKIQRPRKTAIQILDKNQRIKTKIQRKTLNLIDQTDSKIQHPRMSKS